MNNNKTNNPNLVSTARVCLFSQRNIGNLVSRGGHFEFEDVICKVDDVDLISPEPYGLFKSETVSVDTDNSTFNIWNKCANQLIRHTPISSINSGIRKIKLKMDYDLFLVFFQLPRDILSINAIQGWKKKCRVSICWVDDLWIGDLHQWRKQLEILSEFDHVILNLHSSIEHVQSIIGRPCVYMAPGVDMIRFCPYPDPPKRTIDIYSMGRKSDIIHRELLKMSESGERFYLYDTIKRMETSSPKEHRELISNIAKRSVYFMVDIAKSDNHSEIQGQIEIGFRFFEGAGAGTIMLGDAPNSENFRSHFDWPDVVIKVNPDGSNIREIMRGLDADPIHQDTIRNNNIIQSLLRHDWVYRWKDILKLADLKPKPALAARENQLKILIDLAKSKT